MGFSNCRGLPDDRMPLIAKQDRVLLVGLFVAMVVATVGQFARPVRYLLDLTRDVEQSSGLALLPALVILTVVFVFHQRGKRDEARAQAVAAEAGALVAERRANELAHLVSFGEALGRSLDVDAIHDVVVHHLSKLAGSDEAWVMTRRGGHWHALAATAREGRAELERSHQHIADSILVHDSLPSTMKPVTAYGHVCLPMMAAGEPIGVLGVPESSGPLTEARQGVLAAVATLLGISIRNAELFRQVRDNSLRDGLTGCFNRTHALDVLATELRRASRSSAALSVIMFDIDHFKAINDRYGHLCGDAVLTAVGARMREVMRGSDLKCRYGGEEFLVMLPDTPLDGARRAAESLRRALADMVVPWKGEPLRITASFGVAAAEPAETGAPAVIGRADAAMYQAKEQGRNCVRAGTGCSLEELSFR